MNDVHHVGPDVKTPGTSRSMRLALLCKKGSLRMYQRITLKRRGHVLRIVLNRPEQLNCWDTKLNHELFEALENVMDDPDIRFIVFTGEGRSFCAGGDIEEFKQRMAIDAQAYISEIVRKSHEIVLQVRKIGKLTIAAVNGLAAG